MSPVVERVGSEIAGRYFVIKREPMGAAPEAWRCRTNNSRDVLLFLYPDAALVGRAAQHFLSETPYWKGVEHPKLFSLQDLGVDATGSVYGVCALPEGQTLSHYLGTVGALSPREAVCVIGDVLEALSALHDRGIVHKGITSAEIVLVRDSNGTLRGRLLLGGMIGAVAHRREKGGSGKAIGSPHHMAPEQCRGLEATTETDVWAMGIVFYEALRGTVPFDGESPLEVIAAVLGEALPSLERKIDASIRHVIEQCLLKRSADRPPDAGAMRHLLEAATEDLRMIAEEPRESVSSPASTRLEAHGHTRGVTAEFRADELETLLSTVRAESSPPTPNDLDFATHRHDEVSGLDAPMPGMPSDDFDLDFGSLGMPPPASPVAVLPGHALPPPANVAVIAKAVPITAPVAAPMPSPVAVAVVSSNDPHAALFASLDAAAQAPAPSWDGSGAAKESTPDVDVEEAKAKQIAQSTEALLRARANNKKAINPYVAFLGVAMVTSLMGYVFWNYTDIGRPRPPAFALPPDELAEAARRQTARHEVIEDAPSVPTSPETVARPENQTSVEFGEQLVVAIPRGLSPEVSNTFVRHVTTAALPDAANARGFATCTEGMLYIHPGGLSPALRSGAVDLSCESSDIALIPDVDGDHVSDVVAIDPSGVTLLVIGSRNFRVIKRISQTGITAVVGGLTRVDRRRSEPAVVMFVAPPDNRSLLVAVGVRTGTVLWRSPDTFVPASARDYGFSVGEDANNDGTPDIGVGVLRDGNRCALLVSGADGTPLWPAPKCFAGATAQTVSVGSDINDDHHADLAVGSNADHHIHLLSGVDGAELRMLAPESSGQGVSFALGAQVMPDLSHDGFADVVVTHENPESAALEVYSANDGHRIARVPFEHRTPENVMRVQYAEGFAYAGSRSVVFASPRAILILGAAARPELP
jgi:serine/threonine protein kinase